MRKLIVAAIGMALLSGCAVGPTKHEREAYVASHPGLSPEFASAIEDGDIMKGMTTQDVNATFGVNCGRVRQNSWGDTWECQSGLLIFFDPSGEVTGWSGP